MSARADTGHEVMNGKEVSLVLLELARLQIDERHREMDRMSLAKLARPDRSNQMKLSNLLQRIDRSRRRIVARAA